MKKSLKGWSQVHFSRQLSEILFHPLESRVSSRSINEAQFRAKIFFAKKIRAKLYYYHSDEKPHSYLCTKENPGYRHDSDPFKWQKLNLRP